MRNDTLQTCPSALDLKPMLTLSFLFFPLDFLLEKKTPLLC
jgi:hypothetical protein